MAIITLARIPSVGEEEIENDKSPRDQTNIILTSSIIVHVHIYTNPRDAQHLFHIFSSHGANISGLNGLYQHSTIYAIMGEIILSVFSLMSMLKVYFLILIQKNCCIYFFSQENALGERVVYEDVRIYSQLTYTSNIKKVPFARARSLNSLTSLVILCIHRTRPRHSDNFHVYSQTKVHLSLYIYALHLRNYNAALKIHPPPLSPPPPHKTSTCILISITFAQSATYIFIILKKKKTFFGKCTTRHSFEKASATKIESCTHFPRPSNIIMCALFTEKYAHIIKKKREVFYPVPPFLHKNYK